MMPIIRGQRMILNTTATALTSRKENKNRKIEAFILKNLLMVLQ
jgi:hypothetical protein